MAIVRGDRPMPRLPRLDISRFLADLRASVWGRRRSFDARRSHYTNGVYDVDTQPDTDERAFPIGPCDACGWFNGEHRARCRNAPAVPQADGADAPMPDYRGRWHPFLAIADDC